MSEVICLFYLFGAAYQDVKRYTVGKTLFFCALFLIAYLSIINHSYLYAINFVVGWVFAYGLTHLLSSYRISMGAGDAKVIAVISALYNPAYAIATSALAVIMWQLSSESDDNVPFVPYLLVGFLTSNFIVRPFI